LRFFAHNGSGIALLSLFCCLLAGCATPVTPAQSQILWKENYSLKSGETFQAHLFKVDDAGDHQITAVRSGPAAQDCTGGCNAVSTQLNLNPGTYRLEASNSKQPGISSATFTVGDNEYWVWIISDRTAPLLFTSETRNNVGFNDITRTTEGAYRLDLVTVGIQDYGAVYADLEKETRSRKRQSFNP
jgi:hypothetical protein